MDKQFILVAEVKEKALPVTLEPLSECNNVIPFRITWMVLCGKRQVYLIVVSASKAGLMKTLVDETGVYKKAEMFEYVMW